MDINAIRALFDEQERMNLDLVGFKREDTGMVVRYVPPSPVRYSFVLYDRLQHADAAAIDAQIEEQVAYFRTLSSGFEWKFCTHDVSPLLIERLLAHGFTKDEEDSAIMVLELDSLPATLQAPLQHDIRRKHPGDDVSDVLAVLNGAFGEDLSRALNVIYTEMCADPARVSMYIAYVDGQPASCGWTRFPSSGHDFASLWAGSTLPHYRHRGLYTELINVRAHEAAERGYKFVTVDAGSMSRPITEKHGFRQITTMCAYFYSYEHEQAKDSAS
ncbi:MAG: GNAT family N-acetyltransferase [Anaerolineae bacterium]|nr:GNAT family N-acetyltransferase [Anaerolineae bacterium]